MVEEKSEIDFTLDSAFKRLFKSPEFRFYQIAVLADLLKSDYKYIQDNMEYLDTEFVPNSNLEIKRSDCIIEIGKYVVILEMNRQNYRSLKASKLRYLAEVYNSVYFNKDGSESKKEVILVNINAFGVNKKCKDEFILQNKDYQEYCPGMKVLEINIASSMKKWYNKVTLSKLEKRLTYIIMSKKNQEIINEFVKGDDILMQTEKVKTKLKQPLVLNLDPEKEREYELNCIKEDARIDGLAEGRAEANKENAKKMKENGIALDLIAKITGLTKKQISLL